MKTKPTIGVVGFGNMGKALTKALVSLTSFKVIVYEKYSRNIKKSKDISFQKDIDSLIKKSNIVVLAIKPQDIREFLKKNGQVIVEQKILFISIAAGISTKFIETYLNKTPVIRVMPNLAAKVGQSISFICKGKFASKKDLSTAVKIFKTVGEVEIIKENLIDKVTSISGSGPGYIYYFMDSLYKAALNLGFNKKQAHKMVLKTFLGASVLADLQVDDFEKLQKAVTSKKGTTDAGLKVLRKNKVDKTILMAVRSAFKRAEELNIK